MLLENDGNGRKPGYDRSEVMPARPIETYALTCPCGADLELPARAIDVELGGCVRCPHCAAELWVEWRKVARETRNN